MTDLVLATQAGGQDLRKEVPRGAATGHRGEATAVAWMAHPQLSLDEWHSYGSRISRMSKSANWWLGDWVRVGQRRFGLHYKEASHASGYDEQTLMNLAYVAGRFSASRRREMLSWSHHAELAKLDSDDQDFWLDRAAVERLSVRSLRAGLRAAELGERPSAEVTRADKAGTALALLGSVRCPHCGLPVSVSDLIGGPSGAQAD